MKLTQAMTLVFLLTITFFNNSYAACATDDPVAVAKSFYTKHSQFSSENPAKIKTIVTTQFFDALAREYKCAQGEVCALEADPWTDAQDGAIGKPIEFAAVSNSGVNAIVAMTFPFILDKSHKEQKSAKLVLERRSPTECWLIGDLMGPDGDSLLKTIDEWHKQYGADR